MAAQIPSNETVNNGNLPPAQVPMKARRIGHDRISVTFHILDEFKFEEIQDCIIQFQERAPIIRFIDRDIRLTCETFVRSKRDTHYFPNRGIHDFFKVYGDEVDLERTSRGAIIVEVEDAFDVTALCYHVLDLIHDKEEKLSNPSRGIRRVRRAYQLAQKLLNTRNTVGPVRELTTDA